LHSLKDGGPDLPAAHKCEEMPFLRKRRGKNEKQQMTIFKANVILHA
jgi:hypothetical protein